MPAYLAQPPVRIGTLEIIKGIRSDLFAGQNSHLDGWTTRRSATQTGRQNNSGIRALFSSPKTRHPNNHLCHAQNHIKTTKTPRLTPIFVKNPL
jgi:hypothetical protein